MRPLQSLFLFFKKIFRNPSGKTAEISIYRDEGQRNTVSKSLREIACWQFHSEDGYVPCTWSRRTSALCEKGSLESIALTGCNTTVRNRDRGGFYGDDLRRVIMILASWTLHSIGRLGRGRRRSFRRKHGSKPYGAASHCHLSTHCNANKRRRRW